MVQLEAFPDCCGLKIINKFKGGHPGSDPDDCVKLEELDKFLQGQEQHHYAKITGLIAVLSLQQNDLIGEVFLSRKWKLIMDGVQNPRTGSKLFMYFRDLNPTTAREKRIFNKGR